MDITAHQQNVLRALRREMGWPSFRPVNDSVAWSSGQEMSVEVGAEIGRIAEMMDKDLIYAGWASRRAKDPTSFAVAFREILATDIIDRVVPWAADVESRIILASTRTDECFTIDQRGSLVRVAGRPKAIGMGRKLAMKRIQAAAATMSDALLPSNRIIPTGGAWIAPEAPMEAIVQFR